MPTPPGVISLTPAAVPSAPGVINLAAFEGFVLSGITSPTGMGGTILRAGDYDGKAAYSSDGTQTPDPSGNWTKVTWETTGTDSWVIRLYESGTPNILIFSSTEDVATPDLVSSWAVGLGASGTPHFSPLPAAPGTISKSPASVPSAPGTIAKSAASVPSAPGTISMVPASVPSAPGVISVP